MRQTSSVTMTPGPKARHTSRPLSPRTGESAGVRRRAAPHRLARQRSELRIGDATQLLPSTRSCTSTKSASPRPMINRFSTTPPSTGASRPWRNSTHRGITGRRSNRDRHRADLALREPPAGIEAANHAVRDRGPLVWVGPVRYIAGCQGNAEPSANHRELRLEIISPRSSKGA